MDGVVGVWDFCSGCCWDQAAEGSAAVAVVDLVEADLVEADLVGLAVGVLAVVGRAAVGRVVPKFDIRKYWLSS